MSRRRPTTWPTTGRPRSRIGIGSGWYFGVAQDRRRVIIIGYRADLNLEPTHPPAQQPPIGTRTALAGVVPATFGPPLGPLERKTWAMLNAGQRAEDLYRGKYWDFYKLHPRRPAPTIKHGSQLHWHWAEARRLTVEEVKRLQGFPDDFGLVGNFEQQWGQVGNSVPPPLMRAIAAHIRDTLTGKPAQEAS